MKKATRSLFAVAFALATVVATGGPAFAAEEYTYPTADGGASYKVDAQTSIDYCSGTLVSEGGRMNTPRTKRITVRTNGIDFGCVLEIYPRSDSNQYDAFVDQPGGSPTTHAFWKAVHRIRVCQAGDLGRCSPFMQWNGALL